MNILVPDSWLREFLVTEATPDDIKKYLSLCGPSIERIHKIGKEIVYDVEVTSNRQDSMSVLGIAREAAVILPKFRITAKLVNDPYNKDYSNLLKKYQKKGLKTIIIETNADLNPRWTSIVLENVTVKPSPKWLQKKLELTGVRSLNNIVDITNYVMRTYGQPAHAFDFDDIKPNKIGIPYMKLRSAQNKEYITTLDGKTHKLQDGDIVIEDGNGRLIDLCGIMGAENSSIKKSTKTILLFMQTYNPVNIRKTMMRLSHHTEAGSLFEKSIDSELVLPTVLEGTKLVEELAGGKVASQLYDFYPEPYKQNRVNVSRDKVRSYLGKTLTDDEIKKTLGLLGLSPKFTSNQIQVIPPSYRQDIQIDVDVIEEIARIYGYHNLPTNLPETEPPETILDPLLKWEEEIKVRLRDWGFIESYTYSMISETLMDIFKLDKHCSYKISNPLSNEWVYMRPSLWPSVLTMVKQNLNYTSQLKTFELSMTYSYRKENLPEEKPILLIAWVGQKFLEAKGVAQAILELFGIDFTFPVNNTVLNWYSNIQIQIGIYGSVGVINQELLTKLNIKVPITILELDLKKLVANYKHKKKYIPVAKYPPIIEDLTFVFLPRTLIGNVIKEITSISGLIANVTLISQLEESSSFRINYLDRTTPIHQEQVEKLRTKIIKHIEEKFTAKIKDHQFTYPD